MHHLCISDHELELDNELDCHYVSFERFETQTPK
jgi:hypothetical protein